MLRAVSKGNECLVTCGAQWKYNIIVLGAWLKPLMLRGGLMARVGAPKGNDNERRECEAAYIITKAGAWMFGTSRGIFC